LHWGVAGVAEAAGQEAECRGEAAEVEGRLSFTASAAETRRSLGGCTECR
jgi:hypothetical protein